MKVFQTVRGMRDFLPQDLAKRRLVEGKVRECFRLYGYEEIETPVVESFELMTAKAGEDIRHRMYEFKDLGGRRVALRPEMTASVARVVASKLRSEAKPLRLGYVANCFRYDNPQLGRYREFWQAGFELFGSSRVEADAEIIVLFHDLMKRLGFRNFIIKVGSVGILRGLLGAEGISEEDQNIVMGFLDKGRVRKALSFLSELDISEGCRRVVSQLVKVKGTDFSRVFDDGKEIIDDCEIALAALSYLEDVVKLCHEGGVSSDILVDLGFTRGLDYYTGMIFEVFVPHLDIALGGGGRYDKLVEVFEGEPTAAVGCAPGIDRIVLAMNSESLFSSEVGIGIRVVVVGVGDGLAGKAFEVAGLLRGGGVPVEMEVCGRGLSTVLSNAVRKGFGFAVIVGGREVEKGVVTVRDLESKVQTEVPVNSIIDEMRKKI